MMLNWTLFVMFGMFVLNCAHAQSPGARFILTSKALNYISSLIIPSLEKELSQLEIPDISDDIEIMLIGTMQYAMSNIHLDAFSIKSSTVSSSSNGVTFQLSNIALRSECDWRYKIDYWTHIGDNGRVKMSIRNAAIKLMAVLTKSVDGYPFMKITNCEVDLPNLSVDVHGSGSWKTWLYGLFQSRMEYYLKNVLMSDLCDYVNNTATEWNSAISSYPLSKEINNFTITYGLLNDPVFSSNWIQLDLEGEVLTTMRDDIPLQSLVHVLPTLESTNKMIHLMLTDKFFATAITAAIHSGVLQHKITPDQLPLDFPLKLNTRFFKPTVPILFKQFPDSAVALVIGINNYKEIYLDLAGVHISLLGELLLQVIQENEATFDAFSVELEVHCTIEVDILQPNDKPAVLLEATDLQYTLGKLKSSIGDFETTALKRVLNGLSLPLMFIMNEYGRKGFTIPNIHMMNLTHPFITLKKDYIQVSMDFEHFKT